MQFFSKLSQSEISEKRFLLRADFNVPIENGKVTDQTRILKTLPTIEKILNSNGSVAICSHLGRPNGKPNLKYSLRPVAECLQKLLNRPVDFFPNPIEQKNLFPGKVILLQNTRFFPEEAENDSFFAAAIARGTDFFINDAFGTAHREHASNVGVANLLPNFCGLLLEKEILVLSEVLKNPKKPLVFLVGGAKIKTKIGVLKKFAVIAEKILIGGGIANTFLAAQDKNIGDSLFDPIEVTTAKEILQIAEKNNCQIFLPQDFVVTEKITEDSNKKICQLGQVGSNEKILDIGPKSTEKFCQEIETAGTLVWNGPVGLFEFENFSEGTEKISFSSANCKGKKILGGGDTIKAIKKFEISEDNFDHISTGGGAMLEFLEGKDLPGISVLQ